MPIPMVQTMITSFFLCILSSSFLLLWGTTTSTMAAAVGKSNGLTIELMHIFSPASPLYPGNISKAEQTGRLIDQSNARANYLSTTMALMASSQTDQNQIANFNPDMIRPRLEFYPFGTYIMQIGIGTFDSKFPARPYGTVYLYIDTGSDLLWTQCEDCRKPGNQCFQTKDPPYANSKSKSYKPLKCNSHPFCVPNQCIGGFCSNLISYMGGTSVHSILSAETFHLLSTTGGADDIDGIIFGCAFDIRNIHFGKTEDFKITGLLGLANSRNSFTLQIQDISKGVFSFCLSSNRETLTYLRFGDDIPRTPGLKTTKLILLKTVPYYFVNMLGISVNGQKLLINPSVFLIKDGGRSGGCILDNGTSFTLLVRPAYQALILALEYYFFKFPRLHRVTGPPASKLELCYKWADLPHGYGDLPTIVFHFANADLEVKPEAGFTLFGFQKVEDDIFCLAMLGHDTQTLIGSLQQSNVRFIYDLFKAELHFAPEDCAKNS